MCSRSWGAASHTPCLPQRPLHSPAQTPAPRWLSAGPACTSPAFLAPPHQSQGLLPASSQGHSRLTSPAICGPSCLLLLTETQTDVSLLQLQGQALPCLGTSCPVLCTLPILLADAKAPNKSGCPSGGQLRAQATVGGPEHGLGQRRRAGKGSDTTTGT